MLVVGLTGGIGAGKSTATEIFASLGTPIIDADLLARESLARDSVGYKKVLATFGTKYRLKNGELDRPALQDLIFHDPPQRLLLEQIVHPIVYHGIDNALSIIQAPYVLVSVPLLKEQTDKARFDRILVIDAPIKAQIDRAIQRDGIDKSLVEAIIASQPSRQHRLSLADDVINNDGSVKELRSQIASLHQHYLTMAVEYE